MRGHVLLGGEHLFAEWAVDVPGAQVADLDVVVPDLLGGAPEVAVGAGELLGPGRVVEALVDAPLVQVQLGFAARSKFKFHASTSSKFRRYQRCR